jgi:hypothetical protein
MVVVGPTPTVRVARMTVLVVVGPDIVQPIYVSRTQFMVVEGPVQHIRRRVRRPRCSVI